MRKPYDPISFSEMKRFLTVGWGDLGLRTADAWLEFNKTHFAGKLLPLPMHFTPTAPFGKMIGWTCCADKVAHIALCAPSKGRLLVADRGVLLHEMIHQHLNQRGDSPKHEHEPWCGEIMRLHKQITGRRIWACPETVGKLPAAEPGGKRKSVRIQARDPETGKPALERARIATWPHSVGVKLGRL